MTTLVRPRTGSGRERLPGLRTPMALVIAYVVLSVGVYVARAPYMHAWLALMAPEIDWLLPASLARKALELVTAQGQELFSLDATTTVPLPCKNVVVPAAVVFFSTTLQSYALLHPVVVYSILVAWPAESRRARLIMLALGLPCVVISTSLDIPFVLAGLIRTSVLESCAPERLSHDPSVIYCEFLHRGGRLGLAVAAAAVVALAAGNLSRMSLRRARASS